MGKKQDITYLEQRNEVVHAYCDHSEIKKHIKELENQTPIKVGIQRMAKWVKDFGSRSTPSFTNIEITEKLPNSWR